MKQICLFLFSLLCAAPVPAALKAGAAISNTTPPLGTAINGGFRPVVSKEVHDPLHTRALVLDDGKSRLAFGVVDCCVIPREVFDEAKRIIQAKTGMLPAAVFLCATHTHSAGAVADCYATEEDAAYRKAMPEKIAAAIVAAAGNLQPAQLAFGRCAVPQHVFCRRWFMRPGTVPENPLGIPNEQVKMNPAHNDPNLTEPAGPVDPEICFLSVQTTEGKPLALLANYGLHYVGDVGPGHISADYYAAFARRLAQKLKAGPEFIGIMSNGTSGNVNNICFKGDDPRPPAGNYARIELVGEETAAAVAVAAQGLAYRSEVPLACAARELTLKVRKPSPTELEAAKKRAEGVPVSLLKDLGDIYAREQLLLHRGPDQITMRVAACRIGDVRIGAISNEVFSETGLALKKELARHPYFTLSLANGWFGYLPPPEQHLLGGYETWRSRASYLEIDAEPKIKSVLLELLGTLTTQP
ncbi:MAG: hypothetical protein KA004_07250 [Verrucomicrobiales bacterium]|nr:hypothetical protein [Verrucomicrobiales bacterium]